MPTVEPTQRSPSLAEVIRFAFEAMLRQVHVCVPGTVKAYDVTTQSATIELAFKDQLFFEDGSETTEEHPPLIEVPVAQPRSGVWFIHLPIDLGTAVVVHFSERALDNFIAQGGVVDPSLRRMFSLSDAIAVPCNLTPEAERLVGIVNTHLSLGKTSGKQIHVKDTTIALGAENPTDFVALASLVLARLQDLTTAVNTHVHATAGTGPPAPPTPGVGGLPLYLLQGGVVPSVASTVVKSQ